MRYTFQNAITNINNNNGVDGRNNQEQNRNAPIQEGQRHVQGEGVNRRTKSENLFVHL